MPGTQDQILREEIVELGQLLGRTVQEFASFESFHTVERIRRLSRNGREGDLQADKQLTELLESLENEQLRIVIRAFTMFLDLANLSEDRQRLRVLRQRAEQAAPAPRNESIGDAIRQLKKAGLDADSVQTLLDRLNISLVFTAHPTEAKRRSIRGKIRKIRELIGEKGTGDLATEQVRNREKIESELAKWWMTDFIRPWRPTVLQEVRRGLSVKKMLWDVAPDTTRDLREALREVYPEHSFKIRPSLGLGSWIGGDRDGHPYVTAAVTEQTLIWLRHAAIDLHLASCRELSDSLSVSARQMNMGQRLPDTLQERLKDWPELESQLEAIPPKETVRQWLRMIRWRLEQSLRMKLDGIPVPGAYGSSGDLDSDVSLLNDVLNSTHRGELFSRETQRWLDRIRIFGLCLAKLDIRQDSRVYSEVVDELLAQANLCSSAQDLSEQERQRVLLESMELEIDWDFEKLSDPCQETLTLFALLRTTVDTFGVEALGGHIVSMTQAPSDILSIMWLWSHGRTSKAPFSRPRQSQFRPFRCLKPFPTLSTDRRS